MYPDREQRLQKPFQEDGTPVADSIIRAAKNEQEKQAAVEKKEQLRQTSSFIESLQASLSQVDQRYKDRLPPNYLQIQEKLIREEIIDGNERLTVFCGGPLKWDKQGISDSWLIPIEYACKTETGENIELVFHVIAINCVQGTDFAEAQTQINLASDNSLKLQTMEDEVYDLKKACFSQREQKKVIIRPNFDGNLAFPKIQTSLDFNKKSLTADLLQKGCQKIMDYFSLRETNWPNFQQIVDKQNFQIQQMLPVAPAERSLPENELQCFVRKEEQFDTESGLVYATEIVDMHPENAWKVYVIYSCQPLATIDRSQKAALRIDSGCEIGMNYFDGGCDCHQQLLSALSMIRKEGGIVMHLPTQDGRGYGLNTKMQTEGLKWGRDVITREKQEPMSTTAAAEKVFEGAYDIRSYRGAGVILYNLGFREIAVITDNQKKIWALKRTFGNENVQNIQTNTILQLIESDEDPQGIAQMLLKLASDPKYEGGITEKVVNRFLLYAGIIFSSQETFEEKIGKVRQYLGENELN